MRTGRPAGVGAFAGDFDAIVAVERQELDDEPQEADDSRGSWPPPAMAPKTRNATFTSHLAANSASRSSRPIAFCHESSLREAFGVEGFPEPAILPPDGVLGNQRRRHYLK